MSLPTAESVLYATVKTAPEGLGIQSLAKDLGEVCKLNLHLDALATMCLVKRMGLGKAKHVHVPHLWIQEASKSGRFVTKKVGTNVNPADSMTKLYWTENRAVYEKYGVSVRGAVQGGSRVTLCRTSVFPAKCRMKFDRGVFAVGYGAVSDNDYLMVRSCLPKCLNTRQDLEVDTCPRRGVDV